MEKNKIFSRALAAALALVMVVSASACSRSSEPEQESSSSETSSSQVESSSSEPEQEKPREEPVQPEADVLEKLNTAYNQNNDVVGWLQIPDTEIDNEVLHYPGDANDPANPYYLRRDITKNYNWYGCYFADYECEFGDRNDLSSNTVIYGHSMDDNPSSVKFSQLKKYTDIEFLKNHPYIYLTTPEDKLTFKIFAVMYTDTNFIYNYVDFPAGPQKDVKLMDVVNEAKNRSQFDIDVDVNEDDKIITLSTCTYIYGSREDQRFVVMGRLTRPDEEMAATVSAEKNEDVKAPQFT